MMNTHFRFKKSRSKQERVKVIVLGILFVFVLLLSSLVPHAFSSFAHTVAETASSLVSEDGGPFSYITHTFTTKERLEEENTRLRNDLAQSEAALVRERGREVVDAFPQAALYRVISRPPASLYDSIVLYVGESDVSPGDVVSTTDGHALGYVARVWDARATVALFTTPGYHNDVIIGGSTPIPARATGQGGGNFVIELSVGVEVELPAPVYLDTADRSLVGFLREHEETDTSTNQLLYGRSAHNVHSLTHVLIYE